MAANFASSAVEALDQATWIGLFTLGSGEACWTCACWGASIHHTVSTVLTRVAKTCSHLLTVWPGISVGAQAGQVAGRIGTLSAILTVGKAARVQGCLTVEATKSTRAEAGRGVVHLYAAPAILAYDVGVARVRGRGCACLLTGSSDKWSRAVAGGDTIIRETFTSVLTH